MQSLTQVIISRDQTLTSSSSLVLFLFLFQQGKADPSNRLQQPTLLDFDIFVKFSWSRQRNKCLTQVMVSSDQTLTSSSSWVLFLRRASMSDLQIMVSCGPKFLGSLTPSEILKRNLLYFSFIHTRHISKQISIFDPYLNCFPTSGHISGTKDTFFTSWNCLPRVK